jgi:glyoxylase-like metal-dependent hydrolase (beta-lactamase superfamily II)
MTDIVADKVVQLSPLVRRITAPNPGALTGPGTNTYIIGKNKITVLDPGPADQTHIDAILEAVGHKIDMIVVTHTHDDHSPAAKILAEKTGAPLVGFNYPDDGYQDLSFYPDVKIHHSEVLATDEYTLEAIHTPGHVGNHFCYLLKEEGMLFTGDHIMEGSTVVIIPPSGDMAEYITSLELLKQYPLVSLAPGHGHLINQPFDYVNYLIAHRLKREQKVIDCLRQVNEMNLGDLTKLVYDDVAVSLHMVASISLWAHILKLEKEHKVILVNNNVQSDFLLHIYRLIE